MHIPLGPHKKKRAFPLIIVSRDKAIKETSKRWVFLCYTVPKGLVVNSYCLSAVAPANTLNTPT